jgi:hypothetical protein
LKETTGRSLSEDLATTLRTGKERQLAFVECELPGGGRADVLTINPVYSKRQDVRVYEVKTNRRDFHNDVNSGKFDRYLSHARRLYFACPAGLVKKEEVPAYCGLIVRGDKGWRVMKPAPPQDCQPLPADWMVTLMDRAFFKDLPSLRRLADRVVVKENGEIRLNTWQYGNELGRKLYEVERQRDVWMSDDDARKIELADKVLALFEEQGLNPSGYTVGALARAATELLADVQTVHQIGAWLQGFKGDTLRELLANP